MFMYRLSAIIEDIYKKYLPVAENLGVILNLDFPNPTKRIPEPSKVREPLEIHVSSALKRTKGEVRISVGKNGIEIFDNGTTLSPTALALFNKPDHIEAKSRVGFGTKVFIKF